MGVSVAGYNGDLTRTVWLGEASDRLREVYNAVDRAHAAAIAEIRPGQTAKAVDQAARDALTEAGLGDAIVHSVGHGLGMRVHEAPSISIHSEDVLLPGQVFTIEPGVYLTGWGGVRIEDVVVVTKDGFRVLSAAPKMAD
jgi:Xaa-Pro aminopeptidase